MMKLACVAAFLVALAIPAAAQVNDKSLTFACTYDTGVKRLKLLITNPNTVDRKCDISCTYTASDQSSYSYECKNVAVFKNANGLEVCSDMPKGPPPLSNLKASGKC
jgi:hypothetical protein